MKYKVVKESKEVKLGYAYILIGNDGLVTYCVCVGKTLVHQGYIFAILTVSVEVNKQEIDSGFIKIRDGKFGKEVLLRSLDIRRIRPEYRYMISGDIKLLEKNEINKWITQLKLSGHQFISSSEVKCFGYIGDWKKREKIPCEERCVKNEVYVREPVAYLAIHGLKLGEQENIPLWAYSGTEIWGLDYLYLWEETTTKLWYECGFAYGLYGSVKKHKVKEQPTNLVRVQDEWW